MSEDWFTDPNWHDHNEVIDPGGAAAGPGAIAGGVPASLVSNITNNAGGDPSFDWLHDFRDGSEVEEPLDAGGAAAGPGAIAGGVPGSLVSNVENADGTGSNGSGNGGPFEVDYAELERFAKEHDLNAQELAQWASGDPDFPERYLATHGKVNFGTYLKIKEFMISKQVAGNAFAEQHLQTSTALRGVVTVTETTDEANAAAFNTTRMV
jgi:hypothetical protein